MARISDPTMKFKFGFGSGDYESTNLKMKAAHLASKVRIGGGGHSPAGPAQGVGWLSLGNEVINRKAVALQ